MLYFHSSSIDLLNPSSSLSNFHEVNTQRHRPKVSTSRKTLVDRNALLNLMEDEQEEQFAFDTGVVPWPPVVTAIPEVHPSPESTRIDLTTASVDSQFCPGHHRCRFLLPLWIGEQESRSQVHLTQILHLAASLNRTVVLPNVSKSRIGACGKWKLGAYYDVGNVARQLKDIGGPLAQVTLLDDFKTWVTMRPEHPVGQVVFLSEKPPTLITTLEPRLVLSEAGLDLFVDKSSLAMDDPRLKNAYCLQTKFENLRVDLRRPVTVHANISNGTSLVSTGNALCTMLQQDDVLRLTTEQTPNDMNVPNASPQQDSLDSDDDLHATTAGRVAEPDVLVLHWDLRHFPFVTPHDTPGLEYSEQLRNFVGVLTTSSQPYLAVHWKMETVQASLLPDCAEALVDTLGILLADPTLAKDVKTVWLATDQPKTSETCTKEREEALAIVRAAFELGAPLGGWTLTSTEEEVKRARSELATKGEDVSLDDEDDDDLLWEDSGILEILDKMVAIQATLFVTGARGCGKPRLASTPNDKRLTTDLDLAPLPDRSSTIGLRDAVNTYPEML